MTQDIFPPPRQPGLMSRVIFTSSGTFSIGNYPGAQSVRVIAVGGGGGSGGTAATGAGEAAVASGGGGGGYAESLIDASSLATSETVTVGAGGAGGAAGDNDGSDGGASSLGSLVVAGGGGFGYGSLATSTTLQIVGGLSGAGTTGDFLSSGDGGGAGLIVSGEYTRDGFGGGSALAGQTLQSGVGTVGRSPGGGGAGAVAAASTAARSGGDGADGIVIVEVYSTYTGETGNFATRDYVDSSVDTGSPVEYESLGSGVQIWRAGPLRTLRVNTQIAAPNTLTTLSVGDRPGEGEDFYLTAQVYNSSGVAEPGNLGYIRVRGSTGDIYLAGANGYASGSDYLRGSITYIADA